MTVENPPSPIVRLVGIIAQIAAKRIRENAAPHPQPLQAICERYTVEMPED